MRMGGVGGMGGGGSPWALMRSLRRDDSVTKQKLPPGTVKRIARFAAPYRWKLTGFLVMIVIDALVGAANPLLYREIIDQGIGHRDARLIVVVALIVAGLAVVDAALNLAERWVSSVIGEGLIYDMRTRVFDH